MRCASLLLAGSVCKISIRIRCLPQPGDTVPEAFEHLKRELISGALRLVKRCLRPIKCSSLALFLLSAFCFFSYLARLKKSNTQPYKKRYKWQKKPVVCPLQGKA